MCPCVSTEKSALPWGPRLKRKQKKMYKKDDTRLKERWSRVRKPNKINTTCACTLTRTMARLFPNKMDETRLKERWSKGTETYKDMQGVRSHVD